MLKKDTAIANSYDLSDFSAEFRKSRNRLIYFCGIGIILSTLEIEPDSSILGLKFRELDGDGVTLLFFVLSLVFLLDFAFRMIEEWPILFGSNATTKERLKANIEKAEGIYGDLRAYYRAFELEFKKILDELASESAKVKNQLEMNLAKLQSDLQNVNDAINKLGIRNYRLPDRAGYIRMVFEYFSGPAIFIIFVCFLVQRFS